MNENSSGVESGSELDSQNNETVEMSVYDQLDTIYECLVWTYSLQCVSLGVFIAFCMALIFKSFFK